MSRYCDIIHKSELLTVDAGSPSWLSPNYADNHPDLNGILNRIFFTSDNINFILTQRDKHVNDYRKKMKNEEELGDTAKHLVIYTEAYFLYCSTCLNANAELIHELLDDTLPEYTDGDFSKLWEYLQTNNSQDIELNNLIKNKTKWFPLFVRMPRNQLLAHDKKTSGYGWVDHEIDVFVGKHGDVNKDEQKRALQEIFKIKSIPSVIKKISNAQSFSSVYREIIMDIDKLSVKEINLLVRGCGIAGISFPYIPLLTPKMQEFMNNLNQILKNKFQMCPNCKKPSLAYGLFPINTPPQSPKDMGWEQNCPHCNYSQKL